MQIDHTVGWALRQGYVIASAQHADVGGWYTGDHVNVACQQRGHAGRAGFDWAEFNLGPDRSRVPVIVIANECDGLTRLVAAEFERAGADGSGACVECFGCGATARGV